MHNKERKHFYVPIFYIRNSKKEKINRFQIFDIIFICQIHALSIYFIQIIIKNKKLMPFIVYRINYIFLINKHK